MMRLTEVFLAFPSLVLAVTAVAVLGRGLTNVMIAIVHWPIYARLSSLDMGLIVITGAALSFLGLGPDVGYADWGTLINLSRTWILGRPGEPFAYWYVLVYPGAAIFLFVLGWNLLGDAFRDILDPRLRGAG